MKIAILIGAASGIGKELARLLIDDGFKVGINGRRSELLESLKSENPDSYFIIQPPIIFDKHNFI